MRSDWSPCPEAALAHVLSFGAKPLYHLRQGVWSWPGLLARYWRRLRLPQVIINHIDEDLPLAQQLVTLLDSHNIKASTNAQLPVGHRLDEYLEAALPTTGCVVTVWTRHSAGSPRVRDVAYESQRLGTSVPVQVGSFELPLGHRSVRTLIYEQTPDAPFEHAFIDNVTNTLAGDTTALLNTEAPSQTLSARIARRVIEALMAGGGAVGAPSDMSNAEQFQLGDWLVDAGANSLILGDVQRRIQPRAMEVLVYLVSKAPATVSVEDMLNNVWRDRVVVDTAVHRCVSELRDALDDDSRNPRYIETIPRRGYRIVASVGL